MKRFMYWLLCLSFGATLLLSACAPKSATAEKIPPSKLEEVAGTEFKRVILTEKAAQRIGIETATVGMEEMSGGRQKVIPYAAILYGLEGETWVYTNPEQLVYMRQAIVVDHIDGDKAVLSEGPDVNTAVVTVGVSLLYGAEVGVSK